MVSFATVVNISQLKDATVKRADFAGVNRCILTVMCQSQPARSPIQAIVQKIDCSIGRADGFGVSALPVTVRVD